MILSYGVAEGHNGAVASEPRFAGFMSYVRKDDEHDNGYLSAWRRRLQGELEAQTAEAFAIFQDRENILWGQAWRSRIEEAIDGTTILVAILTPRFFASTACRDEIERFFDREAEMGRRDLVFPLYYMSTPSLDSPQDNDALARRVADRQYRDWRRHRFLDLQSSKVRREIRDLATEIIDAVYRSPVHAKKRSPDEIEPLGLVEQMAVEEDLTVKSDELADVQNRIAAALNSAADETLEGKRSPRPAHAVLTATRRLKDRMDPLVAELEAITADYVDLYHHIDVAKTHVLNTFEDALPNGESERKAAILYLISTIRISDILSRSIDSGLQLKKVIEGSLEQSSTTRQLDRRRIRVMEDLVAAAEIAARWGERARIILTKYGEPIPAGRNA
jgi:hypothetical protein